MLVGGRLYFWRKLLVVSVSNRVNVVGLVEHVSQCVLFSISVLQHLHRGEVCFSR